MSANGLLDVKTSIGGTDGDDFYDFVRTCTHLLPYMYLQPYNSQNPHFVVILDNCAIHHVQKISEVINDVGSLVIYLPPYSPDFKSLTR